MEKCFKSLLAGISIKVMIRTKDRRERKGGVGVAEQERCSCATQDGWNQRRSAFLWDNVFFFSLCVRGWALWQPPTVMNLLPGERTAPDLAREIGNSFSVSFSFLEYLLSVSLWWHVGKYIKNYRILEYLWLELYIVSYLNMVQLSV